MTTKEWMRDDIERQKKHISNSEFYKGFELDYICKGIKLNWLLFRMSLRWHSLKNKLTEREQKMYKEIWNGK